ncbi:MAG: TlpA family protein disulfide reductase [Acidimicrobiia bacterium]
MANTTEDTTAPTKPTRMWFWLAIAGLAVVIALVAYAQGSTESDATPTSLASLSELSNEAPTQGDPAADFSVPTHAGDSFSLSEHLANDGRPVFLNLWASWCFPCRAEMPAIDVASASHPDVLFIGVAVNDSLEDAEAFADEVGVSYTLAYDDEAQVANGYPVLGMPATFLISADGRVVKTIFGSVDEALIAQHIEESFGL